MRPTVEQHRRIRALLAEVCELRDAIDADGENDLGGALQDAAGGLKSAVDMIEGRGHGQMDGKACTDQRAYASARARAMRT